MKKLLYSALALGAVLSMSSCAGDEPIGQKDNDGKVQFVINLDGAQTRAFGETTSCNELVYTVFDMDGKVVLEDQTQALTPGAVTTTVNLQLVANQQYQVIFYAHNTAGFSSYSEGVVTVNYSNIHVNSTTDDAFINKKTYNNAENQVFTADGNAKTVYLTRPFAQVNIGTDDLTNPAVEKILSGVSTQLSIAKGLYTTYTALPAEGAEQVTVPVESAVTASTGAPEVNTDFPVNGYSNVLSMYMLVPQTQDMIDATYTINLAGKPAINTLNLNGMPVQGNYRTNVYGSLLTTQNQFNVKIEPNFDGNINQEIGVTTVETADELVSGLQNAQDGDVFKVAAPMDIAESGIIEIPANVTLDIPAGVTVTTARQGSTANIVVGEGKTLTLTGEGTFSGDNRIVDVDGKLIVNGPTFNTSTVNRGSAISVNPGGKLIFEDGTINAAMASIWVSGTAEINGGEINSISTSSDDPEGTSEWSYSIRTDPGAQLTINGGKFIGIQGVISPSGEGTVVTINGGLFVTENTPGKQDAFYAVYCTDSATVTINGGYFYGANKWRNNLAEGNSCVVSGDNDVDMPRGSIIINGGYFNGKAYNHTTNAVYGTYKTVDVTYEGYKFTYEGVKE